MSEKDDKRQVNKTGKHTRKISDNKAARSRASSVTGKSRAKLSGSTVRSAGKSSANRKTESAGESTARRSAGSSSRKSAGSTRTKGRSGGNNFLKIVTAVVVLAVVVFCASMIVVNARVKALTGDTDFPANFQAGGVDLGSMSKSQAVEALDKNLSRVGEVYFSFVTQGKTSEISLKDLGVTYRDGDASQTADKLYNYIHEGSVFTRYKKLKEMTKGGGSPLAYAVTEDTAANALKNRCIIEDGAAVNATYEERNDYFRVTKSKNGTVLDTDGTIAVIDEALGEGWDHSKQTIQSVTMISEPEVTTEMLLSMKDRLGSFSTSFSTAKEGRVQNVTNGCKLVSGHVIQPGEEFSCNAVMAPYTEENGYTEAGSYEAGEVVESMGGGICQVSSTLYNAVLYAELEVTWRAPHSMMVHYVNPGRDAAITGDTKDLQFINNTGNPIYIWGQVVDGTITFAIMGTEYRDPNRRVEFSPDCTKVVDYVTTYKASDEYDYGVTAQVAWGSEGGDFTLYKLIYDGEDYIESEKVNESQYNAQNTIYAMGIRGASEDEAAAVEAKCAALNEKATAGQ